MCDTDFFFFFSSRRRHTRLTCDWSSDVCSSDLGDPLPHTRVRHDWDESDRAVRGGAARAVYRALRQGGLPRPPRRSEEHTSELQSHVNLVCRLLLEKKKHNQQPHTAT